MRHGSPLYGVNYLFLDGLRVTIPGGGVGWIGAPMRMLMSVSICS